eukprot:13877005-Alexandrium_andersonii.AAC.1
MGSGLGPPRMDRRMPVHSWTRWPGGSTTFSTMLLPDMPRRNLGRFEREGGADARGVQGLVVEA